VAGSATPPIARLSVTKKAFPPVRRWKRRRLHGVARVRDESRDPVDRQRRHEQSAHSVAVARSPSSEVSGWRARPFMPIGHDQEHGAVRCAARDSGARPGSPHRPSAGPRAPAVRERRRSDPGVRGTTGSDPAAATEGPISGIASWNAPSAPGVDVVGAADPHAATRACDPCEGAHQSRLADPASPPRKTT
jgi:hypothetical protein